jgi:hypothetical protein
VQALKILMILIVYGLGLELPFLKNATNSPNMNPPAAVKNSNTMIGISAVNQRKCAWTLAVFCKITRATAILKVIIRISLNFFIGYKFPLIYAVRSLFSVVR